MQHVRILISISFTFLFFGTASAAEDFTPEERLLQKECKVTMIRYLYEYSYTTLKGVLKTCSIPTDSEDSISATQIQCAYDGFSTIGTMNSNKSLTICDNVYDRNQLNCMNHVYHYNSGVKIRKSAPKETEICLDVVYDSEIKCVKSGLDSSLMGRISNLLSTFKVPSDVIKGCIEPEDGMACEKSKSGTETF